MFLFQSKEQEEENLTKPPRGGISGMLLLVPGSLGQAVGGSSFIMDKALIWWGSCIGSSSPQNGLSKTFLFSIRVSSYGQYYHL